MHVGWCDNHSLYPIDGEASTGRERSRHALPCARAGIRVPAVERADMHCNDQIEGRFSRRQDEVFCGDLTKGKMPSCDRLAG